MWKEQLKRYGKITAAAVFLTAAGFYYSFTALEDVVYPLRDDGRTVEETTETETTAEETTETAVIYVHICGAVREPGVYELPEGSRIFEAVEEAGGFTEYADESSLNLAQILTDSSQLVILTMEEAEEKARAGYEARMGIVNINTATKEQLMTLTGIGESRAEDIIRYRDENGEFRTTEEIMNVPGIKESAYMKIKNSITV